jgi:hypothetical protein
VPRGAQDDPDWLDLVGQDPLATES